MCISGIGLCSDLIFFFDAKLSVYLRLSGLYYIGVGCPLRPPYKQTGMESWAGFRHNHDCPPPRFKLNFRKKDNNNLTTLKPRLNPFTQEPPFSHSSFGKKIVASVEPLAPIRAYRPLTPSFRRLCQHPTIHGSRPLTFLSCLLLSHLTW